MIDSALQNIGYPSDQVEIITDTLMYAELRGNNQGIIKLITGALSPTGDPSSNGVKQVFSSPVSAKLDGGQQCGMVVLSNGVDLAIEKAKISGISIIGCSNYASATGALGVWARKIADQGLIGIVMSQCSEMVAPYGCTDAIFGTNPIAVGLPTSPRIVFDMATSATAYYGLKTLEKQGKLIERDDIAYDKSGNPTLNPTAALVGGAIRVFDRSYKGSHIALLIELLAGALTGAAMDDKRKADNWAVLSLLLIQQH